jgi:protein SCO1/2
MARSATGSTMRLRGLCLLLALGVAAAAARSSPAFDPSRFSYLERPGTELPRQILLLDSDERPVRLGDLSRERPLILVPAYFHCANLCGVVRASLLGALRRTELQAGRDYILAVLSIDPHETSADAREAKMADVSAFGSAGAQPYWHYLTGSSENIKAVTDAIGFRHRFDPESKEFVHPAGIVFVTGSGIVSNYLLGVGYTPTDLRSAVRQAGSGRIAAAASSLLLICFHFDPTTGRYSLEILKLFRLAALLTVLTLAVMLFLLFRRERIRP